MGKGASGEVAKSGMVARTAKMGKFIKRVFKICLSDEIPGQARNEEKVCYYSAAKT
jgi:hypothetical protein